MADFYRTYLLNRQPKFVFSNNNSNKENEINNIINTIQKNRQDFAMQMEYRNLDKLIKELEKEIYKVKTIRKEMEKYKRELSLTIEDEATKKIEELIDTIDSMFK